MMADIKSRGFDEAIELHARRKEKPTAVASDPTVPEFIAIYRQASKSFRRQPSTPTADYYIRCVERICETTKCRKLSELTGEKVKAFQHSYLSKAAAEGRSETQAQTSLNSLLRNAKALFSREAMEAYQQMQLNLFNPFISVRLHSVELNAYSPLNRETVDSLWRDAQLLRDGDPDASKPKGPPKARTSRSSKPSHSKSEKYARIDFTLSHPGAYLLLLLELGLGLRRNEADKAEWGWFHQQKDGRWFLSVQETKFFRPKNRKLRTLPVEAALYKELIKFKTGSRFIVPGRELRDEDASSILSRRSAYRADRDHRTLTLWLRQKGITDAKPCHLLRKEFGSYVATSFGLFYAQKLLGHSTPVVTDAYYAGLTDLPELKTFQPSRAT